MTRRTLITSNANARLRAVRRLARRRSSSAFLLEGHRQLRRALEAEATIEEVYAAPDLFLGTLDAELLSLAEARGARVVGLGAEAFRSISTATRPDGLVAIARRWPTTLQSVSLDACPLLLVAEGIERPGNLGTLVRSACSSGATGLVSCDGRTDVFHPDAVRGSVGTLFHLPVAECGSGDAVPWLRASGVRVVVATPEAERRCWDARLDGPVAVVVGSERHGVSRCWREVADELVSIPMHAPSDSLNVGVAAGIVLFEALRQRECAVEKARPVEESALIRHA